MPVSRTASAFAMALAFGACASLHKSGCRSGGLPAVQDSLYFGTGKPDGAVTTDEWTTFLETTVTPRFPQGLTVAQATGQWRGAEGSIIRESSHVLQLVHPDDAISEKSIGKIIAAYKTQFRQEAVLRVRTDVCMSF